LRHCATSWKVAGSDLDGVLKKKDEMVRACSTYGERRDVYRVLVGKPEGMRTLARFMLRWKD
jgi:histidinol-phosphate/aromatic aminotransferase/cobyric acid decarboxylase-like protein